jgi:hypothetical protein
MRPSTAELTLADVARRLDHAGVVWMVFAGAAAAVYGADRPVTDLDILVSAADGERVAALFPEGNVRRDGDGTVIAISMASTVMLDFDILAGLSHHTPDLSYKIDLDDKMAARRTYREVGAMTVPVIPREDNILLKAIWRRGPDQGKHDWQDVQAMLAHAPALDWDYLHWRFATCCTGPGLVALLQLLEDEASSLRRG